MKKYLLPLIFILILTLTLTGNCAWLSGYDQRIKLTIDNTKIDAALSDFPVTIFFDSAQGEEIFTEFDADSDYMKCAFTASDGTTQLYAEKELFDIYKSQYPPAQSDTYVKATTKRSTDYWAYYATDPLKLLTGGASSNAWMTNLITNQRFHIDLGSAKIIRKIYYENYHTGGGTTNQGVNNFTFWGSNTGAGTFDDLVYANDEGWTELTVSQNTFDIHVSDNVADPKYITVTNTTAYRYYAFKFADNYGDASYAGVRRIELQVGEAIYHVKVTSVASGADTDIYYYYDNDHADNTTYIGAINTTAGGHVWDDNFKFVCHMVDATTSTVVDSTSNNNDGTKVGANNPNQVDGKVYKGQDFDGNDNIEIADSATLDFAAAFTLEGIANPDTTDADTRLIYRYDAASTDGYFLGQTTTDSGYWDIVVYVGGSAKKIVSDAAPSGAFQHITGVRNADGVINIYVDGAVQVSSDTLSGAIDSNGILYLGSDLASGKYFAGIADELRISSTNRSAAWIKATYNTLWDSLLTYGSEETSGVEDNAIFFGMNF